MPIGIVDKMLRDKYKIVTSCLGIIPVVIEWNQIIENFWRYSSVIFSVLILMGILLMYNHFFLHKARTEKNATTTPVSMGVDDGQLRKSYGNADGSASRQPGFEEVQFTTKNDFDSRARRFRLFKSVFVYLLIATLSIMVSSIYYISKRPVHYVLIKNNVSKDEAAKVSQRVNSKLASQGVVGYQAVRRAKTRNPKEKDYMVSINGGYLSISEARRTFNLLSRSLPGERGIELRTSNASLYRKLEYLGFYFFRVINARFVQLAPA
jgi:hypothetical protein